MFALADLPSPEWAPHPRGGFPVEGGRIHDEQVKADETDLIGGCFEVTLKRAESIRKKQKKTHIKFFSEAEGEITTKAQKRIEIDI